MRSHYREHTYGSRKSFRTSQTNLKMDSIITKALVEPATFFLLSGQLIVIKYASFVLLFLNVPI